MGMFEFMVNAYDSVQEEMSGLMDTIRNADKKSFEYIQDLVSDARQLAGSERFVEDRPDTTFLDPFLEPELDIMTDSVTGEPIVDGMEIAQEEQVTEEVVQEEVQEEETVAEEPTSTDMRGQSQVRGIKNNNPLNIEKGANWDGLADTQLDERFVTFKDTEHGIRAAARILNTYREDYGINTLSGIINRWAPPNENDTKTYTKNVSEWSGVPINKEIIAGNNETTKSILKAMARQENGRDAANEIDDSVYDRALEIAFPE